MCCELMRDRGLNLMGRGFDSYISVVGRLGMGYEETGLSGGPLRSFDLWRMDRAWAGGHLQSFSDTLDGYALVTALYNRGYQYTRLLRHIEQD